MNLDAFDWCRQRLLVAGQPLTASLQFAAAADREAILAVRTVIAELGTASAGRADPGVAAAKLAWWRRALNGEAEHPAVAALAKSGAAGRLPPAAFEDLLEALEFRLQMPRFERFEEFWSHCRGIGGQAALIEYRLHDARPAADCPALDLGAAGMALRAVRDLVPDARAGCWQVPLDLQAQYQVGRTAALDLTVGPGWDGLVRTLVERALRLGDAAAAGMSAPHRHLLVHWAVDRRLARALMSRPREILRRRLLPGHVGNVWAAWRAARQLQRGAGRATAESRSRR